MKRKKPFNINGSQNSRCCVSFSTCQVVTAFCGFRYVLNVRYSALDSHKSLAGFLTYKKLNWVLPLTFPTVISRYCVILSSVVTIIRTQYPHIFTNFTIKSLSKHVERFAITLAKTQRVMVVSQSWDQYPSLMWCKFFRMSSDHGFLSLQPCFKRQHKCYE